MKFKSLNLLLLAAGFAILTSCAGIVVDVSKPVIEDFQTAYMLESDVGLAKDSLPALIKICEGMYRFHPASPYYSGKLCFLMTAYTFAFVDDLPFNDIDSEGEAKTKRTLNFYERSYSFGMLSMNASLPGFEKDLLSRSNTDRALKRVTKAHVETLFWLDFAWAMRILNNTADSKLVLELDLVRKIAERIEALQPDYLAGGVFAILQAYYGGRTESIGGNPKLEKAYYEKGMKYAKGKSTILDYVFLRYVATQYADKKAFEDRYQILKGFDPAKAPEYRFINELILSKTDLLYKKKSWLF
jgi:hypothetical protein